MTVLAPDIVARIRMFTAEEGGRSTSLPAKQFGCPFMYEGEGFDCRLVLAQILAPGATAEIPVKFLCPELVKSRLRVGDRFKLWDLRDFADGEILVIYPSVIS